MTASAGPVAGPAAEPGPEAFELVFHLVPEALWNDGRPERSDFLPEGKIHLFRAGSYRPEVVLSANRAGPVPAGEWYGIAEAEGYVSTVSGRIVVPEGSPPFRKGLVEPVVPACPVELIDGPPPDDGGEPAGPASASWAGITRLDGVSLERGAVYPVAVDERRRFMIPAGRFLTYAVTPQGISAISQVLHCRPGQAVPLEPPRPTAAGLRDLIVIAQVPQGTLADTTTAHLRPRGSADESQTIEPSATVRAGRRATFFFLEVSAQQPLRLEIHHPTTPPYQEELPPADGVTELPLIHLGE